MWLLTGAEILWVLLCVTSSESVSLLIVHREGFGGFQFQITPTTQTENTELSL